MGKLSLTLAWVADAFLVLGFLIPIGMLITTAVVLQLFNRTFSLSTVLWGTFGIFLLYMSFIDISLWFDKDFRAGRRWLHS